MKIDHRLTEQELGLAEESLRRVSLNRVDARLVGRDVVEIDAQINLLALIINLAGSRGYHGLAIIVERGLYTVGEKNALRILDTEINPHRSLRSQIILNQTQGSEQPDNPAATVRDLVRAVVSGNAQTPGLDDRTGGNLAGKTLHLAFELSVLSPAGSGLLASSGCVGSQLMVQSVEGVDLDNVVPHYAPEGAQLFLILAHLGSIRSLGLLDPLNQLVDLLAGRIKLAIDRFIFRRKAVVISFQGNHLLGEVFLLSVKIPDERRLGGPNVSETRGHQSGHGDKRPHYVLETLVFLFLFLALAALHDRVNFCHNIEFLVQLAKLRKLFLFLIFVTTAKNGQSMKYVVRAIKYFIWFALILTLTMVIMAALGLVDPKPELMFREGMKSVWQIAILFAVLAFVYPMTGFRKQDAIIPGDYSQIRDKVVNFMESRGYGLETEEGEDMTFRLNSKIGRAMKMFEDRVTFTRSAQGFRLEGLRKEIVRLISGLEYIFRNETEDNYSKS